MKKTELADKIITAVGDFDSAHVSVFNKKVLTDLKAFEFTGDVEDNAVNTAREQLRSFMNETWPEEPLAHKYVIGSCLALAFLFEKPMHPQEIVHYIVRVEMGRERFYCPYNEKGTVCDFCAAFPVTELRSLWEDQIEKVRELFGQASADIQKKILETGFQEAGVIPVERLTFHEEVRKICEENRCRSYGRTWACPPAAGSLEECRNRVMQYRYLHLFSKVCKVDDSFDFDSMLNGMKDFKSTARTLDRKLRGTMSNMLILSNESCDRCKECTYPYEPCRFPEDLHHAIEGYGFYVNELAEMAGIKYMNGPGTVTFFGAVLY